MKIKKNISLGTNFSVYSFYEDVPNIESIPYFYERSFANDFENEYVISPIDGYVAVSCNTDYGMLEVLTYDENSDVVLQMIKGFEFNSLMQLSIIEGYYINKSGQFVENSSQKIYYTKVEKGQIVKFEFDKIELGTNYAKWAIYTEIPSKDSVPYAYEPVYEINSDNFYIYCQCSGYLATSYNPSYGNVFFYTIKDNIQHTYNNLFFTINCHGDSLTYAGIYEEEIKRLCDDTFPSLNVIVNNRGASGATAGSVLANMGSVPIMLTKEVHLVNGHAKISAISVDENLKGQTFLNYGNNTIGAGISPVIIDGVKGRIDVPIDANSVESDEGKQIAVDYDFYSEDINSNAKLSSKSLIYPYNVQQKQGDITILYVGTNNMLQYSSVRQGVIDMLKNAVQSIRNGKYVVVGLHSVRNEYGINTTIDDINAYNDMARKEFGLKFVDTLSYMITHGLTDAGIEPSESDTQAISEGKCPPSLLRDGTHWTDDAYKIVGKLIFNHMKDLGYFVE